MKPETNWDGSVNLLKAEKSRCKRFVLPAPAVTTAKCPTPILCYRNIWTEPGKFIRRTESEVWELYHARQERHKHVQHGFALQHRLWFFTTHPFWPDREWIHPQCITERASRKYGRTVLEALLPCGWFGQAVVLVIESPEAKVKSNVFNVGSTEENYNKGYDHWRSLQSGAQCKSELCWNERRSTRLSCELR